MGASVGGSRGRRGGIVGINVTPMVDVMLVLLVIMMVSATYIVSRALKVELPKSASSDESGAGAAHGDADEGRPDASSTRSRSRATRRSSHVFQKARDAAGEPSLVVSADGGALHGWVVHVIDLAKQQGITKFAINVQAE